MKGKLLGTGGGCGRSSSKAGSFARRSGKPTGLGSWGKGGWNDATSLANGGETVPAVRGNDAAAVRSEEAGLEVEGAKEMATRIGEWDGGGPGNEFGRIRGASRGDELDGAKFHNTVKRADGVAVPLWPPTTQRMAHSFVGRMLHEESDVVHVGSSSMDAIRVGGGEKVVDTNEIPARASSAGRKIRYEKKLVQTGSKSGSKGRRPRSRGWGEMWMSDRNRKGVHGSERWKWACVERVKEHGRLSGARRIAGSIRGGGWVGEPYFVVLLDVQMAFQWIGKRSVTMIEVSEIRAINGGARKDAGGNR
jgi:hypothetical protein